MQTNNPNIICIIGSPRVGSTLLYQLIVNTFDTFYFTNYINDYYSEHPAEGAVRTYLHWKNPRTVSYGSHQGKTLGASAPSEASNIFKKWFGGRHPSQIHSRQPIPRQKEHLYDTMSMLSGMFNKPIVIKNAWNCFRIHNLYALFPNIKFIWIKRDIVASAISDLATKYERGDREIWSSATTFNYRELQKLPYWKRVVEQQYWYNKIIAEALELLPSDAYSTIWYEDLCRDPWNCMVQIYKRGVGVTYTLNPCPKFKKAELRDIPYNDKVKIIRYAEHNKSKFKNFLWGL